MSNTIKFILFGTAFGIAISFVAYCVFTPEHADSSTYKPTMENEPLYWVAPMDPDFRKDEPGKSPMGMDLVPVYGNSHQDAQDDKGTIRISPDVVNNIGVRTAKVGFQRFNTDITTVGYVGYDEEKIVHIHPRVTGWIETLHVKAQGNLVSKGDPLYTIYSPELVNAQEELLLALERKNTPLIKAAENRLRALQLPETALKQLKTTKQLMQNVTFFSPQSGIVKALNIREGFYANLSDELMSIADLSTVWVNAELFEQQTQQVGVGDDVTMTLSSGPRKTWRGKVDYLYPTLDMHTRTLKVRLRFNNGAGELRPNMFADVTLHSRRDEKALVIPKEAVIRTGFQDRVVLALGDGQFKSIEVIVGRYNSNHAEILYGLEQGEEVVTSAQFLLDSESSKSSDFQRMSHANVVRSAHASGVIKTITDIPVSKHSMGQSSMKDKTAAPLITIHTDAIEKWNRPAQVLDFSVAKGVNLTNLKVGMKVNFTIQIHSGILTLSHIEPVNKTKVMAADTMESAL
ncbi:efflux RND transporter periplasmic adaptor subunit [Alteromonas sp. 5E99-2]|uniref:efflux RND transporter periplasmic adaptor subunit n=1 Tax=Alteromonas sp. 5E99-2 TaxID=2817683 RepID=UPI001A9999C7|nr:efflux RND transporter periplasmic adaptor subunit [Alteromonas sp. 5E99-2]MBO1254508.1 efflux RND transporter periplasmic adaptor subunit [Alteromonas sp. 5E99-2]